MVALICGHVNLSQRALRFPSTIVDVFDHTSSTKISLLGHCKRQYSIGNLIKFIFASFLSNLDAILSSQIGCNPIFCHLVVSCTLPLNSRCLKINCGVSPYQMVIFSKPQQKSTWLCLLLLPQLTMPPTLQFFSWSSCSDDQLGS